MSRPMTKAELLDLTTEIVAAYVSFNPVGLEKISGLIGNVHAALSTARVEPAAVEPPRPAVPVKKSITPDYIVCLEDGKKLKMLKRHLQTHYNMTPDEYRERWGLASDYPMVAPNYAARRRALAKKIGLGRRPRKGGKKK